MSSSRNWQTGVLAVGLCLALVVMAVAAFSLGSQGVALASNLAQPGAGTGALPGPMMAPEGGMAGQGGMMGRMHGPGMMGRMHREMHGGEEMPAECEAMMKEAGMMDHMMGMMHGEGGMDPVECEARMAEMGVSDEMKAKCLEHMASVAPGQEAAPESRPQ